MTVEEFRERVRRDDFDNLLDNVLLSEGAAHVSQDQGEFIRKKISEKFKVDIQTIQLIVVGSAKLGFSIVEKRMPGMHMPRYRVFSAESDIDVAVICPPLFSAVWNELSNYSLGLPSFPWPARRFGDYLVCGWIRPDHFPRGVRLRKCDDWWDTFRYLSRAPSFGRRKIRGALFNSFDQLRSYQGKALKECYDYEKLE